MASTIEFRLLILNVSMCFWPLTNIRLCVDPQTRCDVRSNLTTHFVSKAPAPTGQHFGHLSNIREVEEGHLVFFPCASYLCKVTRAHKEDTAKGRNQNVGVTRSSGQEEVRAHAGSSPQSEQAEPPPKLQSNELSCNTDLAGCGSETELGYLKVGCGSLISNDGELIGAE